MSTHRSSASSHVPVPAVEERSLAEVRQELSRRSKDSELATQMVSLIQAIDSALPSQRGVVVQILAAEKDEGASTVTAEVARVASADLERSVLVLRADGEGDGEPAPALETLASDRDAAGGGLVSSTFEIAGSYHSLAVGATALPEYFDGLRDRFDLTLIDSPPASASVDAVALAAIADGVILVVESDRATWRSGQTLKKKVEEVGGQILGVVLNKRKQHVPAFVRRYL